MIQTRALPLEHLDPDPHNGRTKSDKEAIARLVDSIRSHGILQNLLVRPVNGRFMVVAGHRRLMAARAAGLKNVPVEVHDIDEDTARALQIVENLHREDVTPLDEARAFDRLRNEDRTLEDIAVLVGHSARYVAQRLSLINLGPAARKALRTGSVRLGTAYALARITNPKVQRQALREVEGDSGEPMSVARARSILESRFEMSLAEAPFDPDDEKLLKDVPACMACPKRAGNQPLLFDGPDVEARCTDPACFARKVRAAGRQEARALRKEGHVVHGVKESRERFFERGYRGHELKKEWITPVARASYESRLIWGRVLEEELEQEAPRRFVVHPDTGVVVRIFPWSRAIKVAKAQGHEWAGARTKNKLTPAEKRKRTREKNKREEEQRTTERLAARLDEVDLEKHIEWLADAILDAARSDSLRLSCRAFGLRREKEVETPYGKEKESWRDRLVRAVSEKVITPRALLLLVLIHEQGWRYRPPGTEASALRDRLIEELDIGRRATGKKVQTNSTTS